MNLERGVNDSIHNCFLPYILGLLEHVLKNTNPLAEIRRDRVQHGEKELSQRGASMPTECVQSLFLSSSAHGV
jgi:hypothetical protein